MDDIEATIVTFPMRNNTNTTHVTATSHHRNGTGIKLDEVGNFTSSEVNLDGVVDPDQRVWVPDPKQIVSAPNDCHQDLIQRLKDAANLRSRIMRNQVWDSSTSELDSLDFAELVFCLLGCDAVDCKATLNIINQAEVFASLFDANHVHETGGVGGVGSDLAINFDQALHDNCLNFASIESIL